MLIIGKQNNKWLPWYFDIETQTIRMEEGMPCFVIGDVLMGLAFLYEQTEKEIYLYWLKKTADNAINAFVNQENFLIYDVISYDHKPILRRKSEIGHILLLIDGLLITYEVTKDIKYLEICEKSIDAIWTRRDKETNLFSEFFDPATAKFEEWVEIGTGGEFIETLYYLWYLTRNQKYIQMMKILVDSQIKYFWDRNLDRFVLAGNIDGTVIDKSYTSFRLEANCYGLIRLSNLTGNLDYLDYAQRLFDTYYKFGWENGLPVTHISDKNQIAEHISYVGSNYSFIKSAAILSFALDEESYLQKAIEVAINTIKLKQKYGYPKGVNTKTGEIIDENPDIGGIMWFQGEGLTILASYFMINPQFAEHSGFRSSVVSLAENSFIRGIKVDPSKKSYTVNVFGGRQGKIYVNYISPGYYISDAKLSNLSSTKIKIKGDLILFHELDEEITIKIQFQRREKE